MLIIYAILRPVRTLIYTNLVCYGRSHIQRVMWQMFNIMTSLLIRLYIDSMLVCVRELHTNTLDYHLDFTIP